MKTKNPERHIRVFADWDGLPAATFMGDLFITGRHGHDVIAFEYDKEWLRLPFAHRLDPEIQFVSGRQFLAGEKANFGLFLDSSPDRWGQVLMRRRESLIAKKEEREARKLTSADYLLGVFDEQRPGALRFKIEGSDIFQNDDREFSTPPWTSLRELEFAAKQYENDLFENDEESLKWLNMLLAPGSSLGGARPKAGVKDFAGALWIAKFPSKNDDIDIGAWEMTVHELAKLAGLKVPEVLLKKFLGTRHTFLTKRFDRTASGKRIHFASAMTLLGYSDGADAAAGASYLELAEFIMQHGADVAGDLEELFRRIVFSVCVSNTDDHLRNHGFLLTNDGWRLSPVYDINPNPQGTGLKVNISEDDNALDLELVASQAPYFRLSKAHAGEIISRVKAAVSEWRNVAGKFKISPAEQRGMEPAFSAAVKG